jgi:hypothetical protein
MSLTKIIRRLRVDFSQEELLELAKQIAEANKRLDSLQDEKKEFSSSIKSRIDATNAEIRVLSDQIHGGYEFRPIDCHWTLNVPDSGKKTLYRDDDGVVVETVAMTEQELQRTSSVIERGTDR